MNQDLKTFEGICGHLYILSSCRVFRLYSHGSNFGMKNPNILFDMISIFPNTKTNSEHWYQHKETSSVSYPVFYANMSSNMSRKLTHTLPPETKKNILEDFLWGSKWIWVLPSCRHYDFSNTSSKNSLISVIAWQKNRHLKIANNSTNLI